MKRKLATLTTEEDAAWVAYWQYGLELHYGPNRAAGYAWRQLCKEFPRLQSFDGCKA